MTSSAPQQQIRMMLDWFERAGVSLFDIHLRVPKLPGIGYDDPRWFWITEHERVTSQSLWVKLVRWLRHMNARGSDIYIRPHGPIPQSVLFLDDLTVGSAHRVARKYRACVVETSQNNTQVWLATHRPLSRHDRKRAQCRLRDLGYTDPGSISGDHLGRLCGLKSQKHACWVNCIAVTNGSRYQPLNEPPTPSIPQGGRCASRSKAISSDLSPSAREFGWVLGRLRIGTPREIVLKDLIRKADERGKRNPGRYAGRTIGNAIKVLDMH